MLVGGPWGGASWGPKGGGARGCLLELHREVHIGVLVLLNALSSMLLPSIEDWMAQHLTRLAVVHVLLLHVEEVHLVPVRCAGDRAEPAMLLSPVTLKATNKDIPALIVMAMSL